MHIHRVCAMYFAFCLLRVMWLDQAYYCLHGLEENIPAWQKYCVSNTHVRLELAPTYKRQSRFSNTLLLHVHIDTWELNMSNRLTLAGVANTRLFFHRTENHTLFGKQEKKKKKKKKKKN